MADLNRIIDVSARVVGNQAVGADRFGTVLLATTDPTLAASGEGKAATYSNLFSVGEDFAVNSEVYLAAQSYFASEPFPPPLRVARWATVTAAARLVGGAHGTLAQLQALHAPTTLVGGTAPLAASAIAGTTSPAVTVGGETINVAVAGLTTHQAIADAVQTAIRATSGLTNADRYGFTFNGTNYVLSLAGDPSDGAPATTLAAGALTGSLATPLGFGTAGSNTATAGTRPTLTFAGQSVATLNFLGAASLTAVAANLQTALRGTTGITPARDQIAVTYDAVRQAFVLDRGLNSGAVVAVDFATGTAADPLGWASTSAGAAVQAGDAAESAAEFIADVQALDVSWYWFIVGDSIADTTFATALSAAVEAGERQLILDTSEASLLSATPSGEANAIIGTDAARTMLIYSDENDYKSASIAARFAAINFDAAGQLITANFKSLPGRRADNLSDTEITRLDTLRVNYYTPFGGTPILTQGVSLADNSYPDTRYWLDWFVDAIQRGVFALLRTAGNVPQNREGIALIREAVENVCQTGITNGGIAPGTLGATATADVVRRTGNDGFTGALPGGYLVHIGSIADLTPQQRANRQVPPIYVWAKGAGAVHSVDVDITFDI